MHRETDKSSSVPPAWCGTIREALFMPLSGSNVSGKERCELVLVRPQKG